jgi:hypothetical protein
VESNAGGARPAWAGSRRAVLAALAIVTAVLAGLAFSKQSAEVKLLQEQADCDIEQRRRAQAAKVFISVGAELDKPDRIDIRNTSEWPIYNVGAGAGDAERVRLSFLMPGDVYPFVAEWQGDPLWLEFRDAAGLRWRTTSQGELTEQT